MRGTGYTTTFKVMQLMAAKGLVLRDESGRRHVYRVVKAKRTAQRQIIGRLIDPIFGGSTSALMQQALETDSVDAAELGVIGRLIDARCDESKS